MKSGKKTWAGKIWFLIFLFAALVHALLLAFAVFHLEAPEKTEEAAANIMKLVDVREETPPPSPPPPPPPPPRERPPEIFQNTVEAAAETMVETDEVPDEVISEPIPVPYVEEQIEFLPMHKISMRPEFPEDLIRDAIVYPPIALRSGIEGYVYLELFVDRRGEIRQISVLRETPPGRGFGDAAVNAFKGIRGIPAEANGQKVAVRFRYPVRFKINP